MKSFWTIGKKITFAFSVSTVLLLVLGALGMYSMNRTGGSITDLSENTIPSLDSLQGMESAVNVISAAQRTLMLPGLSIAQRQAAVKEIQATREEAERNRATYDKMPKTDEESAKWRELTTAWETYLKQGDEFLMKAAALDARGVLDPMEFRFSMAEAQRDHEALEIQVMNLVYQGEAMEGSDDPAACAFGRWLNEFNTDSPELKALVDAARQPHQSVHAAVAHIKQLAKAEDRTEAKEADAQELEPAMKEFRQRLSAINNAAASADEDFDAQRKHGMEVCKQAEDVLDRLIQGMVDYNQKESSQETAATRQLSTTLKTASVGACVAGVLAALGLGTVIVRSVNRSLRRIAAELAEGAEQTSSGASQVASAAQQLAEGASEQASALEETSSALEEMAAMTRNNASNARQANERAGQARSNAEQGDKTMAQLGEAMTAINSSSEKISKIIKVIEEIAFQTNLLALNAAVEAARAGEHGKGFAVVADEVRNLAQRAAQAARETTTLIEDAVRRAQEGTHVVGEVGKSLGAIVSDATSVSDLINGITKASEEQAQGVEQINTAVSQMDRVTQQTASGAEESAAAGEQLSAQAATVRTLVDELVQLVEGRTRSTPTGAPTSTKPKGEAGRKPASPKTSRAVSKPATSKSQPVKAAAPTEPAAAIQSDDFLALEPQSDLKEF